MTIHSIYDRRYIRAFMVNMIPDDVRYNYEGKCWWCGFPADTREHKYKRSDLVREFGKGAWSGDSSVVRVSGGIIRKMQGPNSNDAKFIKNLCANCNNSRSQKLDFAYDSFATYIHEHEEAILQSRTLSFPDIFGFNWAASRAHLERYLVKHICCRLAEDGVEIPVETVNYLNDLSVTSPPHLTLEYEIREDIAEFMEHSRSIGLATGNVGLTPLMCRYSASRRVVEQAYGSCDYRWLRLDYTFDITKSKGEVNFRSENVKLPVRRNLTKEEMELRLESARSRNEGSA